ncbi:hypothetical protein N7461_008197 [Penicillium sp. DV-2018c]|nr:hypothetical protein N7461_008197 [Penicillium sp. DV-2018c]
MFRRPRATAPERVVCELGQLLAPLTLFPWGPYAMHYLGVPIVQGIAMIVVRDVDCALASQKLIDAGFTPTTPDRRPAPEIREKLPNQQEVLEQVNRGYDRLDQSTTMFSFPTGHPERGLKLVLIPNSFARLPIGDMMSDLNPGTPTIAAEQYDIYDNLFHPLEPALTESFVKAAVDDHDKKCQVSAWGQSLRAWISMMVGYVEVNNDILDNCADERAVEWYSVNFGRIREEKFGPFDRRVSKRLGSGKEMSVDTRGQPLP